MFNYMLNKSEISCIVSYLAVDYRIVLRVCDVINNADNR